MNQSAVALDIPRLLSGIAPSRAIAVGLATNELITNAVKHAFPEGREGEIDVKFEKVETGWCLSVRDNGIGLPDQPKTGLGAGLIEEFVRQAGGTLSLQSSNGTIARLALRPMPPHPIRVMTFAARLEGDWPKV